MLNRLKKYGADLFLFVILQLFWADRQYLSSGSGPCSCHGNSWSNTCRQSLYTGAYVYVAMRTAENRKISIILASSITILVAVLITGTVVNTVSSAALVSINVQNFLNTEVLAGN
jgi:hypothetical protein